MRNLLLGSSVLAIITGWVMLSNTQLDSSQATYPQTSSGQMMTGSNAIPINMFVAPGQLQGDGSAASSNSSGQPSTSSPANPPLDNGNLFPTNPIPCRLPHSNLESQISTSCGSCGNNGGAELLCISPQ